MNTTITKEMVEQIMNGANASKAKAELKDATYPEKLAYYSTKNSELTMATGNRKLGPFICGLSMPNIITCRADAPCKTGCYCNKGPQAYANIKGTYLKNYILYLKDPKKFFEQLNSYFKLHCYKFCRFFDSGDIPDAKFFDGLVKICNKNKNMRFLMYTKQYEIVNDFIANGGKIPKNFKIYFSTWDKEWHSKLPNPYGFKIAYCDFKNEQLTPELPQEAIHCPGSKTTCSQCRFCWTKDLPVIFGQH